MMSEVIVRVGGMSCEGCSTRLQKVLNELQGVAQAHVTLASGQAVIQYDEQQITEHDVRECIEESGFDVLNA
ncbi:heavy-metal-associated domain-containing protein [Neokomagataea thailandica]|uniref:Cation/copper resistance transporter ATPase CopZ n=1 Tax=Neokomagataea tanensis NBRC 106556 TaxID=1223519 RepID=A0ABQ0QJS6_9PROT|nr:MULTISPECIES: heavy-metal-associated domain-containing protein [Neokomagataea]GBR47337.1 cation/copper resistance transporter ATPase CopZ [Neokomagataea tanensis NBRC 106556]